MLKYLLNPAKHYFTFAKTNSLHVQSKLDQNSTENGIKSGTVLVDVHGADHISGGIYKDDLPIQAGFAFGPDLLKFKLAKRAMVEGKWRTVRLALGRYVLKVRAFVDGRGQGCDDEFLII